MLYFSTGWTLSNKKVALAAREPLNFFLKSTRKSDWRAVVQDIWNYYSSKNSDIYLPKIENRPSYERLPKPKLS